MANNYWQHQTTTTLPSVAQVRTFTITADSTPNNATWTLTLTNDDGTTETVTYTEDGSPTPTEIGAGLVAAWNASTKPHVQQITAATTGAGIFTLTADTAGVPFTVTLDDSSDGTDTETATTANAGINDIGTANNWSLAAVPAGTDDLLFGPGSVAVKYGLDQSAVAIADFRVEKGCSSQFGRFEFGRGFYLKIDPDLFRYEGSGSLAMFDIGSANISPYIASTASSPSAGYHNVYIKGSNIATLYVDKGNVGVAPLDADTATVATIQTSYVSTLASDVDLTVGSGVTLTTWHHYGGVGRLKCAATTLNLGAGTTMTTEGSGAITTINVYGGTHYLNATGTIGTLNIYGGSVYLTKNQAARTVTSTNFYGTDGALYSGSWITHTNKPWAAQGGAVVNVHYAR